MTCQDGRPPSRKSAKGGPGLDKTKRGGWPVTAHGVPDSLAQDRYVVQLRLGFGSGCPSVDGCGGCRLGGWWPWLVPGTGDPEPERCEVEGADPLVGGGGGCFLISQARTTAVTFQPAYSGMKGSRAGENQLCEPWSVPTRVTCVYDFRKQGLETKGHQGDPSMAKCPPPPSP